MEQDVLSEQVAHVDASRQQRTSDVHVPAPEFRVHGVKVHALQVGVAIAQTRFWLDSDERQFRYIVSTNINNIVCALESGRYATVMENADLSLPDGVPLLWIGRTKGFALPERCGIEELMLATLELSKLGCDYSHYFYGSSESVLAHLRVRLLTQFPKLRIVGMFSPPFRPLSGDEHQAHVRMINEAAPDFLWVSLGCPRQEMWLFENRQLLTKVGIGGGSGAVFSFLSGHIPIAPGWIRMAGLEWLWRLYTEPKRLWRRYIVRYPKFFWRFFWSGT